MNWDREGDPPPSSGYWVTTLYEQRGRYWRRLDGHHGTRTFPIQEKWSRWKDAQPALISSPEVPEKWTPDYSNDPSAGVRHAAWDEKLKAGCEALNVGVVVRDSARGRDIEMQGLFKSGPVAKSIVQSRLPIVVTGSWRSPPRGCDIAVLWAGTAR